MSANFIFAVLFIAAVYVFYKKVIYKPTIEEIIYDYFLNQQHNNKTESTPMSYDDCLRNVQILMKEHEEKQEKKYQKQVIIDQEQHKEFMEAVMKEEFEESLTEFKKLFGEYNKRLEEQKIIEAQKLAVEEQERLKSIEMQKRSHRQELETLSKNLTELKKERQQKKLLKRKAEEDSEMMGEYIEGVIHSIHEEEISSLEKNLAEVEKRKQEQLAKEEREKAEKEVINKLKEGEENKKVLEKQEKIKARNQEIHNQVHLALNDHFKKDHDQI